MYLQEKIYICNEAKEQFRSNRGAADSVVDGLVRQWVISLGVLICRVPVEVLRAIGVLAANGRTTKAGVRRALWHSISETAPRQSVLQTTVY